MGRYVLWLGADALIVAASLLLAWSGRSISASLDIRPVLPSALLAVAVYCGSNRLFGVYQRIWRYAAAGEVSVIGAAVSAGTFVLVLVDVLWPGRRPLPLSVVYFTGFFVLFGFVGVRYQRRVWTGLVWRRRALRGQFPAARTRVLIVGAGEAGQLLAWRLQNQKQGEQYQVTGFVDDDPAKVGMLVHGAPVLGGRQAIPSVVAERRVDLIVIAIYNISGRDFRDIMAICESTRARVKILPSIFEFMQSTTGLLPIRDVTAEDLLGRKPVEIDQGACRELLAGKTILVTGAAGSIGSELCRQIARFGPQSLLMLDNNESGLHDLGVELQAALPGLPLCRMVGDVINRAKMQALFARHRPQVVFHAAAYKHVPLMEEHPDEAVRVNVLGTLTIVELACQYGAERFVFISTDKAVSPSSVMGATKRVGELLVSCLGGRSRTLCTCVRFGNVLGSRGSVVPTFERQIDMGGPLTITHPDMTRYFMTIAEAVSLVIQAATITQGTDLFVLDMGEQIRIQDLAERLIRLRGLRPNIDIPIVYTGIRPGEKLHEGLVDAGNWAEATLHPSIFRVNGTMAADRDALLRSVEELVHLVEEQRNGQATAKLWEMVGAKGDGPIAVQPPQS